MNIIAYQIEDGTYRFIYSVSQGSFHVVSVEDYSGMSTFIRYSRATRLSNDIDIYQYAKDMQKEYQLAYDSEQFDSNGRRRF